jgi:DNA invertase Pin-like site-specific DNA recombinase
MLEVKKMGRNILPVGDEPPPLEILDKKNQPVSGSSNSRQGKVAKGRFGVLNTFVDITLRKIDRTAAAVWLILFRDTKPNGLACASHTDLALRAGISVSTVYRALKRLEAWGLIILVRKGRLNVGASIYHLQSEIR